MKLFVNSFSQKKAIKFILNKKFKQARKDLQMNESLERVLDQVSLLKKTLNSEKTSHQNTLQQLETTYRIIDEIKEMLKNEQDKNKQLARQIKEKNNKIDEISHQYESQLIDIKQLIQRKDSQIKKYSQIKVTDYDMLRFRIISQIESQHNEQIQILKKQIKKYQFLNNESIYEIKVLKEKNNQYQKKIDDINCKWKEIEEEMRVEHMREVNKVYGLLEQEKLTRRKVEKVVERQAEKNKLMINKYHKQLQTVQLQLLSLQQGKQNTPRFSNNIHHQSPPLTTSQLNQSQLVLQNDKLKHQLKQKNEQLIDLNKKHKSQTKQLKRRIDDLEKNLNDKQYQIKQVKQHLNSQKLIVEQQTAHRVKLEYQKKHQLINESYQLELLGKDKEIKLLKKQLNDMIKSQSVVQLSIIDKNNVQIQQQQREKSERLKKENQELKQQLKKFILDTAQLKKKAKIQQYQNRQARTQSVRDVKDKLHAANAQIVNLLKDKIALNDQIAKMKLHN